MNPIPQQLLISGTVLFLLSLLAGFAVPALTNPRMGVALHVAGLQSGMSLWALGLLWPRLALPAGAERAAQVLVVLGLYAVFASLLLAALWGTSRATPMAGVGHRASAFREAAVATVLLGGSLATTAAVMLVLWGLCAWRSDAARRGAGLAAATPITIADERSETAGTDTLASLLPAHRTRAC